MISIDIVQMIGNLSKSFIPVQSLVSALGYLLGILMVMSGLARLKKIHKHSQERVIVPICFIIGGAVLIYLPTSLEVVSNTFFGTSSALQYTEYNPYDIYSAMRVVIQTAGLIWFVRGTVLLVRASSPDEKHGVKGFVFICAGILAMNFEYTMSALDTAVAYLMTLTK